MTQGDPSLSTGQLQTHELQNAVLLAHLGAIKEGMDELRDGMKRVHRDYVTTAVWTERNLHYDHALGSQGREIGELRVELRSRRTPWPTVAAVVISGMALFVTLTERIAGG